jgi:hypothetical protein
MVWDKMIIFFGIFWGLIVVSETISKLIWDKNTTFLGYIADH